MTSGQEGLWSPSPAGGSTPNDSTASPRSDQRRSLRRLVWAIGVVLAGLACIVVAFVLSRGDSGVRLSSTYDVAFDNLTYDIQGGGSFTEVTEDENGDIRGHVTVGDEFDYGTGSFTGTVVDGTIDFVVDSGVVYVNSSVVYTGIISSEGVLSGTFTTRSQRGEWTATPTEAAGDGLPWWLWLAVAGLVLAVIGTLIVRRLRPRPGLADG